MFSHHYNTNSAARTFWSLASREDFNKRFDWDQHDKAEVEAIWDEVISLIPNNVTKVLEVGCGNGEFCQRLRAARPSLEYVGIDIVQENVATCQALMPAETFEHGNVWEYLRRDDRDWDYVVSIATCFTYTDMRHNRELLQLLDAASPKGFFVVGRRRDYLKETFLTQYMPQVEAASTNISDVYYEGTRAFLDDSLLKGLWPVYINRDSSSRELPDYGKGARRLCTFEKGSYNRVLAHAQAVKAKRRGDPIPTHVSGIVQTKGIRTGSTTIPVDFEVL